MIVATLVSGRGRLGGAMTRRFRYSLAWENKRNLLLLVVGGKARGTVPK